MAEHKKCGYCRTRLFVGAYVLGVQKGVMGQQRFVPLEELELFCGDECLSKAFNGTLAMPERLP